MAAIAAEVVWFCVIGVFGVCLLEKQKIVGYVQLGLVDGVRLWRETEWEMKR